jgi:hypothetical protein
VAARTDGISGDTLLTDAPLKRMSATAASQRSWVSPYILRAWPIVSLPNVEKR